MHTFKYAETTCLEGMAVPRLTFSLELLRGEDGFVIARWKEFPGVVSQGKTTKQARDNALEALMAALEALAQDSPVPDEPQLRGRRIQTSKVDLVPA
jgi:predicted RNase H-like HicB family nuclease